VGWVGGPTRVGFDPLVTTLGPLGVFRVSERERGVCVAVLGNQAPEFSVYHMLVSLFWVGRVVDVYRGVVY
jgi:hypothetical protein